MEKTIRILAIVLVAQLLLAVGMSLTGPNLAAAHPDTPLFTLGDQPVDHLTIEGPDSARVVLAKQGEGWVLPDNGGYPADKMRVDTLLSRLEGLQRGLPVATTSGALKRFKVSDESFERRVVLAHGDDTLATLYLGSSPGMHHVHARSSKDDAVYAVDFAVYEAPDKAADWEDKAILQFPAGLPGDHRRGRADAAPCAGRRCGQGRGQSPAATARASRPSRRAGRSTERGRARSSIRPGRRSSPANLPGCASARCSAPRRNRTTDWTSPH